MIIHCRICGCSALTKVLDLGDVELTDRFPRAGEAVPSSPIALLNCRGCDLLQIGQTVDPDELYRHDYGYRSGINRSMAKHLRRIAQEAQELVGLGDGDVALDVASNDGTLLSGYAAGPTLVGIDPAADGMLGGYPHSAIVASELFSAERFRALAGERKAKIVTSIAVLYHLDDPVAFVRDVASILAQDGVWVAEFGYAPGTLGADVWDPIGHEHVEYYGLRQIARMVNDAGLVVLDARLNDVNGGSLQVWLGHDGGPHRQNVAAVESLLAWEQRREGQLYSGLADVVERSCSRLRRYLLTVRDLGGRIVLYGASTRGNIILHRAGVGPDLVECAAEVNPSKYGCETPGTRIPIVSDAEARARHPTHWLVLPWHFRRGILAREGAAIAAGQRFVFPLPRLEVVGLRGTEVVA